MCDFWLDRERKAFFIHQNKYKAAVKDEIRARFRINSNIISFKILFVIFRNFFSKQSTDARHQAKDRRKKSHPQAEQGSAGQDG